MCVVRVISLRVARPVSGVQSPRRQVVSRETHVNNQCVNDGAASVCDEVVYSWVGL